MGGGYSESRGGWDGEDGGGGAPVAAADLISQREGKRQEVDQVLTVLRDINNQYGVQIDTEVGTFPPGAKVMGYYDEASGNVGINRSYFDADKMDAAMESSANARFHPPTGGRSGIEAVTAHEAGHALTAEAAKKMGTTFDKAANRIVQDAKKNNKVKGRASDMARRISGYAGKSPAEAVAEAVGDVQCNGRNARQESKYIVNELNQYL